MSTGIIVTRTSDGFVAFVMIAALREATYPVRDEILNELKTHGISFGIDTVVIDEMILRKTVNKQIKVATGIPPKQGTDGRIEVLIDFKSIGKPKVLADGRVDHHNITYVLAVSAGDVLARHIPPVPGAEGTTVVGKSVPAQPVKDAVFSRGVGTVVSPTDPNLLIAEIDGGFWIDDRGTIEVHCEKTIAGDIDYQTGNINFPGDLTITGTVRSGFSVEAKGTLQINGSVEDAKIKSCGNIVIRGGAFGSGSGAGSIECEGSVTARHLENFHTRAEGEVIVSDDILHGSVSAGKRVSAKAILGGIVSSMECIEVDIIGSEAEIKTVLDIGKKYERLQERYRLLQKMSQLTTELGNNKEAVFLFVKSNLNDAGLMSAENEIKFVEMKEKTKLLHKSFADIQKALDTLDILKIDGAIPYIKVRTLFPNTLVKFGSGEQLIREKMERVRLLPVERGNTVTLSREGIG